MKRRNELILAICLTVLSCGRQENVTVVNLADHMKDPAKAMENGRMQVERVIDIPLAACPLRGTPVIWEMGEKVGLLSDDATVLILDVRSGEVTGTISRKGNGPGEYLYIDGVASSQNGREIFVFDNQKGRVQVYAEDGSFLRSIPAPAARCRGSIAVSGDRLYWTTTTRGAAVPAYYVTDLQGHLADSSRTRTRDQQSSFMLFTNSLFSGEGESLFLRKPFCDTLFRISDGGVDKPDLVLDLGNKAMPEKYVADFDLYYENEGNYAQVQTTLWSRPYLFVSYVYIDRAYHEVWDTDRGITLFRFIETESNRFSGIPLKHGGEQVLFWPRLFASDGLVYGMEERPESLRLIACRIRS